MIKNKGNKHSVIQKECFNAIYWILDGKKLIKVDDVLIWSNWFEKSTKDGSRFIKQEEVNGFWVSTVFLGLDHSFGGKKPLIFETMVFSDVKTYGGKHAKELGDEIFCERYSTYSEAEKGHKKAVEWTKKMNRRQKEFVKLITKNNK